MCILNTMEKQIITALELLKGTGVSIIDSARFVKNILDSKTAEFKLTNSQYCAKVVQVGIRNIRSKEMTFEEGFKIYYEYKTQSLRSDSLRDIRIIGRRLIRSNPAFAKLNFSELSRNDCEDWLSSTFKTPSQFNKGRAMLHALFQFAFHREWCEKNPIKLIERKKVIEKEITPLSLNEIRLLLKHAKLQNCLPMVAVLIFAGIRPREAKHLEWTDINLCENFIKIRSQCSKTGGVRHVEICPALKRVLLLSTNKTQKVCPRNWTAKWKIIRDNAGFKGHWVQDVLRHTYASFYAKRYHNLPRLQLNMGHRNISLLNSRYINMHAISNCDASRLFN